MVSPQTSRLGTSSWQTFRSYLKPTGWFRLWGACWSFGIFPTSGVPVQCFTPTPPQGFVNAVLSPFLPSSNYPCSTIRKHALKMKASQHSPHLWCCTFARCPLLLVCCKTSVLGLLDACKMTFSFSYSWFKRSCMKRASRRSFQTRLIRLTSKVEVGRFHVRGMRFSLTDSCVE